MTPQHMKCLKEQFRDGTVGAPPTPLHPVPSYLEITVPLPSSSRIFGIVWAGPILPTEWRRSEEQPEAF